MKKHLYILLVFCLILAFLPQFTPASAETDMIMTVFDYEYLRNVTPETMPFPAGGVLYIYYEDYENLGIIDKAYYHDRLQQVRLFNINQQLTFDLSNSQTYDEKGNKFEGIALWQNGRIFLPARTVRDKFDLYYSYVSGASPVPVAILCSQSVTLKTDKEFLEETESFRVDTVYTEYQDYLKSIQIPPETGNGGQTTSPPTTVVTPQPEPEPKLTYLTFYGALNTTTPDLLTVLDNGGAKAAFFIPPDSIVQTGDLLRQTYAAGHTIGLLLEAGDDPVQTVEAANQLLKSVLFTKSRLICLSAGADSIEVESREMLINNGYRLWDATIIPQEEEDDEQDGQSVNQSVRNSLYLSTTTSVIGLNHSQSTVAALPDILRYIAINHFSLLTMKEWDTPINRAGDVR